MSKKCQKIFFFFWVVVGGGAGGLELLLNWVKKLGKKRKPVTLVDSTPYPTSGSLF